MKMRPAANARAANARRPPMRAGRLRAICRPRHRPAPAAAILLARAFPARCCAGPGRQLNDKRFAPQYQAAPQISGGAQGCAGRAARADLHGACALCRMGRRTAGRAAFAGDSGDWGYGGYGGDWGYGSDSGDWGYWIFQWLFR
jgi:hypothetical protein